jgi:hypothetical protein
VAVMPSIGRIKQVAVLGGVAAGLLAVGTSSASAANDVWLWACQGPTGQALNTAVQGGSGDCASGITLTQPSSLNADGNAVTFPGIQGNTRFSEIKLTRAFSGFGQAGSTSTYTASTSSGPLETVSVAGAAPADGTIDVPVTAAGSNGDALSLKLNCAAAPCSTPASVKVTGAAMKIVESTAAEVSVSPHLALGGKSSPAAGDMNLDVRATDAGVGLDYAEAYLANANNTAVVGSRVRYRFADADPTTYAGCRDLTPGTPTVDLPLGAVCPTVGNTPAVKEPGALKIDTLAKDGANNPVYPNGIYTLIVRVVDMAGNETIFRDGADFPKVEILNNPNLGQSSQQLSIGTSGIATTPGATNNGNNNGGVAGASSTQCSSPRLSAELAQKPMRVTKGTPVLQKSKRYLFKGRLTCVVNGKRQSAPKRARIDLQNKVGKKTTDVSGTTIASKGAFKIILSYRSSRSLIFRFTNSEGKVAKVTIKIKVEKKKAKR